MTCTGPDCNRPVARSGLCWGHEWQRRRGRPLRPLRERYASAWERLAAAMQAYTDAETDEDFDRAKERCRAAAKAFIASVDRLQPSCRMRADLGVWECRVRVSGKRVSFYAASESEARAKALEARSVRR